MPYSVSVDQDRKFICIAVTGEISVEGRAAGLRDVVGLMDSTGIKRVLVDFRFGSTLPAPSAAKQQHAAQLAREYKSHFGTRLAYVSSSRDFDENAIEVLAAAYGYFYERFTDIGKAIDWLTD